MLNQEAIEDIYDTLESIQNRCKVMRAVIKIPPMDKYMFTLLEDNCEDIQRLVTQYCVKEELKVQHKE